MLFLELLQIALGNRDRLSHAPSAKQWAGIYEESKRQAVTGILLHGIDRLPAEQRPSQAFLLQWIGVGQMIEQRNRLMNGRCVELLRKLKNHGQQGAILKGQGIAKLYDGGGKKEKERDDRLSGLRQSGDIDVYVDCGLKGALAFAKSLGQDKIEWDYKHLHLKVWRDTEVEMHYRVEVLLNLWKNRKLQKWFKAHKENIFGHSEITESTDKRTNTNFTNDTNEIITPTVEFNVFYILLHIYRHFLYEGIGLRQIVDYYFVLKANTNTTDKTDFAREAVREFGMEKFAKGLMWVMHEAMGMPEDWMLWKPDQKEGEYILKQVMKGGNFGHYDGRLQMTGGKLSAVKAILKHNLHLLTHYPSDTIWAPVWIIWHKCWKVFHS